MRAIESIATIKDNDIDSVREFDSAMSSIGFINRFSDKVVSGQLKLNNVEDIEVTAPDFDPFMQTFSIGEERIRHNIKGRIPYAELIEIDDDGDEVKFNPSESGSNVRNAIVDINYCYVQIINTEWFESITKKFKVFIYEII
jgi:hypothetical protein